MSKNNASAIGIIGGADGPTSVFMAGKVNGKKLPLKARLKHKWKQSRYKKRRETMEKTIVANPHTLDEVILYMKDKYGAVELSKESRRFMEQQKYLKESLILKYMPELLGDLPELEGPKDFDQKSLQEYMEKVNERTEMASQVPEELFPIDYHIYEMHFEGIGDIHFEVEKNWSFLSGGYSGKKKGMKKLGKINRDIYQYYGVTQKDIDEKSERYSLLLTVLASEN